MPDRSNQIFASAALRMLREAGYEPEVTRQGRHIRVFTGAAAGGVTLAAEIQIEPRHGTVPISDITKLLQAANNPRKA